jgi:general secretion pathway protein B
MSYILDALRKADQERTIGNVPDLDTPHWSRRRGSRIRYWVWGAIGLLIINGVLLAFLFNRDDGGESVPEQVQSKPGLRNYVPQPQSARQPERVTKPEQAKRIPLKPMARPERNVMARPRQPVPAVVKEQSASKAASVAHGNVAPAAVTRVPVIQQAEPVQRSAPEIPEWNELSLEFRSGFNPPRLDVHVYDDEPSRRFILVDLKRFAEGDTLDSGAKLEKIQPGSIQLYYQGTRFRYDR